ncbi:DUF3140 domain-containing protein [Microbacterium hydrocarbonoxydans]|uniref:DUF3140 domain-containing protein n=1 Tax=Microbacterium hydrocarbonoxydans TaxID=273678 RepID=UPI0020425469|nr:DUF3140 domain-containing protein [Microbacterium hydrocarbonoxydans]MCM3780343.1 DUF3140 domain-containing protein [Microbacterium hydrocarbonoxydans]
MTDHDDELADVWDDWRRDVNMAPKELEQWLETEESRSVGDSDGGESTGHRSGRRIVTLLRKKKTELTRDDIAWMRKVVGYVARHGAQRPHGDVTETRWRYSLMNWGHDPLKDEG